MRDLDQLGVPVEDHVEWSLDLLSSEDLLGVCKVTAEVVSTTSGELVSLVIDSVIIAKKISILITRGIRGKVLDESNVPKKLRFPCHHEDHW